MPAATLHALVADAIDYAGLFPPSALTLESAAANYAEYRRSSDAWALGRFVVPATRLPELAAVAQAVDDSHGTPWRVSALVGEDAARDARAIHDARADTRLSVECAEVRVATPDALHASLRELDRPLTVYAEIPVADDSSALIDAIANAGVRAKIRTGGITKDVFPRSTHIARFVLRCAEHEIAFKATAGLHHAVCGDYRLTYADDAPRGAMFGFLNLLSACAFARAGMQELELASLLEDRDVTALRFDDTSVTWRDNTVSRDDVTAARRTLMRAFGSCSFREPIDELQHLGLL